jgi:hypothetical protein
MESTPTGAEALRRPGFAQLLLAGTEVVLFIAFLLPWWSVTVFFVSASLDGFHSWGWLSFVAWLATLALTARIMLAPTFDAMPIGKTVSAPLAARLVVAMGAVELLGNVLFIAVAPSASGSGVSAGISAGVVLAMICGLAIMYSGLFMLGVSWLPRFKGKIQPHQ